MTLILRIRHFRCENPSCPQKYFAEPLPLAGRYARMSREVASRVLEESLFQPSRSACETLRRQHISVSRSTCLRMANRQGCRNPEVPTSGYVGIDDFASRKGRIYMSAVVDHYTHQPVAVFNSRYGCEIAEWLRSHPEIKLVTRDGSQAYAEIIRSASPSIQQVADRFHLMKNLKEVAVDLVKDMIGQRRRPQELPYPDEAEAYECIVGDICRMGEARHRQKVRQCMQARRLRDEGQTMAEMAEALGVNTRRVYILLHTDLSKLLMPGQRMCMKTARLIARIIAGRCLTIKDIIQRVGDRLPPRLIRGCIQTIIGRYREKRRTVRLYNQEAWRMHRTMTSAQIWKFILTGETDSQQLKDIAKEKTEAGELLKICIGFRKMIHAEQDALQLEQWIRQARECGLKPIKDFADYIEKDRLAVELACKTGFSNALLEGTVNKAKAIKRSMYNRANVGLLRAKVILHDTKSMPWLHPN